MKRFRRVALVWLGAALAWACGAAQEPHASTAEFPPDAGVEAATLQPTIFQSYRFAGSQTTFTTSPTSLAGAIDTSIVERMVSTRLHEVEKKLVADAFNEILFVDGDPLRGPRPSVTLVAVDLLHTLASLAQDSIDGNAKSQSLVAAIGRAGLALTIAHLAGDGFLRSSSPNISHCGIDASGQADEQRLIDATYHGLGSSLYLRALGFQHADRPLSSRCEAYAADVALLVDGLATHLDDLDPSDIADEPSSDADAGTAYSLTGAFETAKKKCSLASSALSIQAKSIIAQAEAEGPTLRAYKALRDAFVRVRLDQPTSDAGQSAGVDAGDLSESQSDRCFMALSNFEGKFTRTLGKLAAETDDAIPIDSIRQTVARLHEFTSNARAITGSVSVDECVKRAETFAKKRAEYSENRRERDETKDDASARIKRLQRPDSGKPDAVAIHEVELRAIEQSEQLGRTETRLAKDVADLAQQQCRASTAQYRFLRDIITRLTDGKPLRRGDIFAFIEEARHQIPTEQTTMNWTGTSQGALGYRAASAVLDGIQTSVREDAKEPGGVRIAIPELSTTLLATFREDRRGLYLRATIGTGFALTLLNEKRINADPSQRRSVDSESAKAFYEELGVGYRWPLGKNFLAGPQAIVSGLLFDLTADSDYLRSRLFFGLGFSVNAYKLLELSANLGWMPRIKDADVDHRSVWGAGGGFLVGLQLPLIDYFKALSQGSATESSKATSP